MTRTACIFGASQGIGLELVGEVIHTTDFQKVFATHRPSSNIDHLLNLKKSFPEKLQLMPFEAQNEKSLELMVNLIQSQADSVDLLVNCIGSLLIDKTPPEKNIKEVRTELLMEAFATNTIPTLLIAKHFQKLLQKTGRSIFISLSAKVGSIEDNQMGGWYSYRVSKAALNMCIKNLSIEFNRLGKRCTVFAVHPGTTETGLSKPFLKAASKKYTIHTANETALNILKLAQSPSPEVYNGKFISWTGEEIPW